MDKLRSKIDGPIKVLETRFTLYADLDLLCRGISLICKTHRDIVWTVHNNLRGEMQTAFANVFDPQLIQILRMQLQPLQHGIAEILQGQDCHAKAIKSGSAVS
jgi:hypothetical protein